MNRAVSFALAIAIAIGVVGPLSASTKAFGTVIARQSCEAYISKKKRSNPDHTRLVIDQTYSVFEVNKPNDPDWFRVHIDSADPPERWIAEDCGTIEVTIGGDERRDGDSRRNLCKIAGFEDGYVLALSWQPAFCESHRGKPECGIDDRKSYQARNFTLHGLWPNKSSCGTNYGFCGEINSQLGDFCEYPMLPLMTAVRSELEQVMPSAAAGSCLQRHEWFKHGTCQKDWSLDEYYETAVDLTRQFNESGIAYLIFRNIGDTITEEALIKRVDCAHGAGAHKALELKCANGNLVDVYVHLPETIHTEDGIGELMRQAQGAFKSNCGGLFRVDPIGFVQ
jgi:ribonuclease T2